MTLQRGMLITLRTIGNDTYDVFDNMGNMIADATEEFFIYMSEVSFENGEIKGKYLGKATVNLLDRYCLDISFSDKGFTVNDRKINNAKMVAVENRKRTVLIAK